MNKKFGAFSSSVDPEKLGATVQGIILGLSGIITLIAAKYGIQLLPADLQAFSAQAAGLTTQLAIGASAVVTIFGLIRKVIVRLTAK